jgi:alcohol dehydrogenase class IV
MSEFTVAGPPDFEVTCNGLTRALDYFTERGCCRLFVLSDPFLVSNGLAAQIEAINQSRFQISIFSDFVVEPKLASV